MDRSLDNKESELVATLASEYESMFCVDLLTGVMSIYRMDNRSYEKSHPTASGVGFPDYIEHEVVGRMAEDQRAEMLAFASLQSLRERLSHGKSVSMRFSTTDKPPRYKEMRVAKVGSGDYPDSAVVTISDRTEVAEHEFEAIRIRQEFEQANACCDRDRENQLIAARDAAETARRELDEISNANSEAIEKALVALHADVSNFDAKPFLRIVLASFSADICFISRIDSESNIEIINEAGTVMADGGKGVSTSFPLDLFSAYRPSLVRDGFAEFFEEDIALMQKFSGSPPPQCRICSIATVPITINGVLVGSLSIGFKNPHRLNKHELGHFMRLASIFGSVVERAETYRKLEALHIAAENESTFVNRVINASPSPCFIKDVAAGGRYVRCNNAFAALVGRKHDDIPGKTIEEVCPFADFEMVGKRDREALESDVPILYEDQVRLAGGEIRYLQFWKQCLSGDDGRKFVLGVITDVTSERVRSEAESFKADVSTYVVEHRDQWQICEYISRKLMAFFDCDHVLLTSLDGLRRDLFRDDVAEGVCLDCLNCPLVVGGPELFASGNTLKLEDRSIQPILIDLPIVCPTKSMLARQILVDGKPWGRLAVIFTRTKSHFRQVGDRVLQVAVDYIALSVQRANAMAEISRKNHEILVALDEAKRAERTKGTFLATMSHEIRTPLNAVIGFSEFLRDSGCTEDERARYLDGITKSSNALLALINDILDLSKLESGSVEIRGGDCDIGKLFAEMASVFQFSVLGKGIQLTYDLPEGFPRLALREERVRQILLNLVGNAVKFTEKGGVKLRASISNKKGSTATLIITVSDTGIGISQDKLSEIFDPFAQDGSVRGAKVYEGTGLGLPISRRLAEAAGGTLVVESEVGKGSVFTLTLPGVRISTQGHAVPPPMRQATANPADGTPPGFSPAVLDKVRFLLVDDVQINLLVLAQHLIRLGVPARNIEKFITASDALDALKKNAGGACRDSESIVVVMTDMWMPSMNGEALAQAIHNDIKLDGIPVIAVTADADAKSTFDINLFESIITKPIAGCDIINLLAGICQWAEMSSSGGKGGRHV